MFNYPCHRCRFIFTHVSPVTTGQKPKNNNPTRRDTRVYVRLRVYVYMCILFSGPFLVAYYTYTERTYVYPHA